MEILSNWYELQIFLTGGPDGWLSSEKLTKQFKFKFMMKLFAFGLSEDIEQYLLLNYE